MEDSGFLLYADLEPEGLARLDAAPDEDAARAILAELLKLPTQSGLRQEVLLELYMNTLRFAREKGFSVEKTSTFFSIIMRNHKEMVDAFLPPDRSWEFLKSLLERHSVQRPPHSVGIFTLDELKAITSFALTNYYAHFKLYRYAFTLRHVKEIDVRTSWAELPPASFPPLGTGVEVDPLAEAAPAPAPAAPIPIEIPPIELHADVPDAVKEAVEAQIAAQVAAMRAQLEQQYADSAAQHVEQIKSLEQPVLVLCLHGGRSPRGCARGTRRPREGAARRRIRLDAVIVLFAADRRAGALPCARPR